MATKTSASAFNSFFYQQQQQHQQQQQQPQQQSNPKQMDSMSNQNNGEQVSDLHLKMSKKIAQLTKVFLITLSKFTFKLFKYIFFSINLKIRLSTL